MTDLIFFTRVNHARTAEMSDKIFCTLDKKDVVNAKGYS